MRFDIRLLLTSALIFFATSAVHADDTTASDVYKSSLPSVMTLEVTLADGSATGTGFLAVKDGVAVTAWHVVNGAKSVKAKFADGEVDDVTGVIDKDEKNDIALIRVKESGRAMLKIQPDVPDIGSKAIAIGAPQGLEFSVSDGIISQFRDEEGRKEIQFTSPISPGNSGGPLMTTDGSVIGVVVTTRVDAQNVNFAIPIRKILALDPTLPTTPWATVTGTTDVDDALIARSITAYINSIATFESTDVYFMNGNPYDALDKHFFHCAEEINDVRTNLANAGGNSTASSDIVGPLQKRLDKAAELLKFTAETMQSDIDAGYVSKTKEYYNAALAEFDEVRTPWEPGIQKWLTQGAGASNFSPAQMQTIGIIMNQANYTIGGTAFLDAPNQIYAVSEKKSISGRLGLRNNDTILKVNDATVTSLKDVDDVVTSNSGKSIKITIDRNGKSMELSPKVPSDLPTASFDFERPR